MVRNRAQLVRAPNRREKKKKIHIKYAKISNEVYSTRFGSTLMNKLIFFVFKKLMSIEYIKNNI